MEPTSILLLGSVSAGIVAVFGLLSWILFGDEN